jgi:hypothetical protein
VLNARIRKAWTNGAMVGLFGEAVDLTYDYKHMGTDRAALVELVGRVTERPKPLVIIGQGAINEADGEAVLSQAMAYARFRREVPGAAHGGGPRRRDGRGRRDRRRAVGGHRGRQVIYNLGADEVEISRDGADAPFVIYQGSMATGARTGRTSSCRALPIPKRTGFSSTPRGGRSWPSAPGLRRARPRKTGRSCGPCRRNWARSCRGIRWPVCARRW